MYLVLKYTIENKSWHIIVYILREKQVLFLALCLLEVINYKNVVVYYKSFFYLENITQLQKLILLTLTNLFNVYIQLWHHLKSSISITGAFDIYSEK